MDQAKAILKEHGLRLTLARVEALKYFLNADQALQHSDLEEEFTERFDRATLYRTINTFLENGIIHKVMDDTGIALFAVCADGCTVHEHKDEHVHFKCTECGSVKCLESNKIPNFDLPRGYELQHANILLEGSCPECR